MPATGTAAVRITVVSAPACHFCDDAERRLDELGRRFAFEVEHLSVDSPEGRRLVAEHRPALTPLVLVDGAYFSAGRLPGKKLTRLLSARSVPEPAGGPDGQ